MTKILPCQTIGTSLIKHISKNSYTMSTETYFLLKAVHHLLTDGPVYLQFTQKVCFRANFENVLQNSNQ